MDFETLVQLVIDKFYSSVGYSELTKAQLTKSITLYFEEEYKKQVQKISHTIKKEEAITGFSDTKRYQEEHEKIEDNIIFKARVLSANSFQDLQDLVKSS